MAAKKKTLTYWICYYPNGSTHSIRKDTRWEAKQDRDSLYDPSSVTPPIKITVRYWSTHDLIYNLMYDQGEFEDPAISAWMETTAVGQRWVRSHASNDYGDDW